MQGARPPKIARSSSGRDDCWREMLVPVSAASVAAWQRAGDWESKLIGSASHFCLLPSPSISLQQSSPPEQLRDIFGKELEFVTKGCGCHQLRYCTASIKKVDDGNTLMSYSWLSGLQTTSNDRPTTILGCSIPGSSVLMRRGRANTTAAMYYSCLTAVARAADTITLMSDSRSNAESKTSMSH